MLRHFLQFKDLSRDELLYLFERATLIKSRFKQYQPYHPLADRTLAMIFEKSSTRTRLSFEAGMHQGSRWRMRAKSSRAWSTL